MRNPDYLSKPNAMRNPEITSEPLPINLGDGNF